MRRRTISLARPLNLKSLSRLSRQDVVFPFFHTISDIHLPHISKLYVVPGTDAFERDLDQLLQYFEPLSMGEYLDGKIAKKSRPAMVLTFDDGLKGCHEFIAPMLRQKGIPATFFLNNHFIDNGGLFFRYKASLLIHQMKEDCNAREAVSSFLKIPEDQVEASILMIDYDRRSLLDVLAVELGLDYTSYLRSKAVYLTQREVKDLLGWSFDIGAHSTDHIDFRALDRDQMIDQVNVSIDDLVQRYEIKTRYFSFPFTSDGIPEEVIDSLLETGIATALMGTSGMKRTGKKAFIQRIPMEQYEASAVDALKAEYLYYLLKVPLGRNRYRY